MQQNSFLSYGLNNNIISSIFDFQKILAENTTAEDEIFRENERINRTIMVNENTSNIL